MVLTFETRKIILRLTTKGKEVIKLPSPNDMVQMINRNNHDPSETIKDLNELLEDIENLSWKKRLIEEKLDYCDRTFSCPDCGTPLEIIDKWEESRGEMMGREVYEEMCTVGCTKCNYIKE